MTTSLLLRPDRLAALRQTALLDTPPEEAFDRLTRMAARLLGASIALISLVTDDRQFFKSAIGLAEPWASLRTAPISFSFCSQVVATGEPLILEDARKHPLLRHSPAIRELGWVAYAGVPLVTRDGHVVGSFGVVDRTPRLWSERDIALLQDLAASAVTEIELRREMTQRRQAELGRRDVEEQFNNTFEHVGLGMAVISLDGRWFRVNPVLSEMLGRSAADLLGLPMETQAHPDDAESAREARRLLLAGECPTYEMEQRFVLPSGEVRWALVNVSLVAGPEGQPSHFVAAFQDVTDRKQADIALRASEERYRLLARAHGTAIREWDLSSDELTWDTTTGPLLDYRPEALGSQVEWWYDRIHPEDRERVVASIAEMVGAGQTIWSDEYRFRRADGAYVRVEDRGFIARDESGKPIRLIGGIVVASERATESPFQRVLEALPLGVWLVDVEGRMVLANGYSHALWGHEPPETIDQLGQYSAWWTVSGRPLLPEEWGLTRALRGESSFDQEITIETPEGERKQVLTSAVPIYDAAGRLYGAVSISQDVTARKAAEAAQLQHGEHERQAQRMEAVGRLAGGIAHDFNNLLTGILSYSDLILQELRPGDPIRADVEQIRDAGHRAAALTRQLLAFSRRQLLQPRVVSLNITVTDLEPMLHRLLGAEVALETELDPQLGNVLVDPAQVEQVLVNLVLNAREAMPKEGRLNITTANVELESGRYVTVSVSDTGVGIDRATQERIFEPFFTTRHGTGSRGLGLSTVYGIVEQSGGFITVDSEPGQGATFTIYLPRYSGPGEPVGTAEQRRPEVGTETLLLVEDEAAVRASVKRLLESHGYTVLEARNGADALEVWEANENGIDLVLTDVVMPEMGGHELVERLRAQRPDLRVVFMSGYTERILTTNGSMPPATGYLEKPFTAETLMRRLREVLDEKREQ